MPKSDTLLRDVIQLFLSISVSSRCKQLTLTKVDNLFWLRSTTTRSENWQMLSGILERKLFLWMSLEIFLLTSLALYTARPSQRQDVYSMSTCRYGQAGGMFQMGCAPQQQQNNLSLSELWSRQVFGHIKVDLLWFGCCQGKCDVSDDMSISRLRTNDDLRKSHFFICRTSVAPVAKVF